MFRCILRQLPAERDTLAMTRKFMLTGHKYLHVYYDYAPCK